MFVFSFTVYVSFSGKKNKCDQAEEENKPAEGTKVSPAVRSGPNISLHLFVSFFRYLTIENSD